MDASSLDYLVYRSEEASRHSNAEHAGGTEVDDELELGWLHDRHIGWLFPFEESASVNPNLAISVMNACSITYQTAYGRGGTRTRKQRELGSLQLVPPAWHGGCHKTGRVLPKEHQRANY